MTSEIHRVFEARLEALAETAAFIDAFARDHDVARDDALRLTLIVEELFTNTVRHGEGQRSGASIRIVLSATIEEVVLLYEDTAPPYDPLSQLSASPPHLAESIDARPVGGLGMHLVAQLSASPRYAFEEGCNRLWLRLRRQR